MSNDPKPPERKQKTLPERVRDCSNHVFDGMDEVAARVFNDTKEVINSVRGLIGVMHQGVERHIVPPVRIAVAWVFKVRIPRDLQELGLTESLYLQLEREFYICMRKLDGVDDAARERAVEDGNISFTDGCDDALRMNNRGERGRRAERILTVLIERHQLSNIPEITSFLKSQLLS